MCIYIYMGIYVYPLFVINIETRSMLVAILANDVARVSLKDRTVALMSRSLQRWYGNN